MIEVGQDHTEQGKQVYTFSHYSPMQEFGVDSAVSGQLVDWGVMYEKILQDIYDGSWNNTDLWWLAAEGAAHLGSSFDEKINAKFGDDLKAVTVTDPELGKINVYDLVMKRFGQMQESTDLFDPFIGPIRDNKGNLQLKQGQKATKAQLLSTDYYVENVVGDIPR